MSIPAKRIGKVVIAGTWYTVAIGSFEIINAMEFTDDSGNPIHTDPIDVVGYRFVTDNHDLYYGPLSAIQLFKLVDV